MAFLTQYRTYRWGLTVIFCCVALLANMALATAGNHLQGVRIWAAPESTRVVLDLSQSPDYSYFVLKNPERLVIDLKQSANKVDLSAVKNNSKLVKKVRTSGSKTKDGLRLVIELNRSAKTKLFALKPAGPYGNRLVVDFSETRVAAPAPTVVSKPQSSMRDVIIAIDAGHGGDDPGSIGASGLYEKVVTLEMSKRIAKKINATKGMKAVMIRTGDYFVNLNKRSQLARDYKADLLISIHADAFTTPKPKGASIWVLSSKRANSEIGRVLEDKEQHSELLGGVGEIIQTADNEQYLAMTLVDMSMDRSRVESQRIASRMLKDLGAVTHLHKHAPESASLAVLKSPDIPSILVELGFMSNPSEEKLLKTSGHQEKLAKAIHQGVVNYFTEYPPEDSLLAMRKPGQHSVRSGESLSVIAQQYGVSVATIKQANQLNSDVLRIGQQLTIPR